MCLLTPAIKDIQALGEASTPIESSSNMKFLNLYSLSFLGGGGGGLPGFGFLFRIRWPFWIRGSETLLYWVDVGR